MKFDLVGACEWSARWVTTPAPFFFEPRRLPLPARDLRSCSSSPLVLTASFGAFDANPGFPDTADAELPFASGASLPTAVRVALRV